MDEKIVYQTDSMGFFVGETVADRSPLETDVFLIPARCVEVAPPADVPEGKWPRWNGSSWIIANIPTAIAAQSAKQKLKAFFDNNPDVRAYVMGQADGGADV